MDTFFVSVERKYDPSLVGMPVIVGGGPGGEVRRGVVAACSYETRVFGVHSAMPLATALKLCPKAILIPVGRSNYGAETAKVREVLEGFTDHFEMTSPDEAYLDLEGTRRLHGPPIRAAHELRRRIAAATGLPVSVGLATTTTMAKMASKLGKPQGLFTIFPGQEASIVRHLPLRALPGLGPKTEERLRGRGIRTLGELIEMGAERLGEMFGEHGIDLHQRATGGSGGRVTPERQRAQISTEETYGEDLGDRDRIDGELARMTMKVGARLRKTDQRASTLTLKIRYPDFTTLTRQVPLEPPSHDDTRLLSTAKELFMRTWDRRTPLRLLGVGVSNMTDFVQEDLFSAPSSDKKDRLLAALDSVRETKGKGKLLWASALKRERQQKPD